MPQRPIVRHKTNETDALRRRTAMIAIFVVLWMCVIVARLMQLQIAQHEFLSAHAETQQRRSAPLAPTRGGIFDRNENQLAHSIETESFFAVPYEIADAEKTAAEIAKTLGANDSERKTLAARLTEAKAHNRKFVWLARQVENAPAAALRAMNLHGVYSLKEEKRVYPNNSLAAHILGFVGLDDKGLGGVEQFSNASFKGESGKVLLEQDARHHVFDSSTIEARNGQSLILTIDENIQYQVEKTLAEAVAESRAKSGASIVLDPHTGEILALANVPTFDPNAANRTPPELRANHALQDIYEPGSTFKIVAYSAAIEEKLARPNDTINCQGGQINVFGRTVHDHTPYGVLTLTEALAKSSNVAAIKLGMRVGNERMYDYITRFGFGRRTNVELPGETSGLVRSVARWQPSSIGSIAIGQEVGVTPLQMAAAYAAIANDGVRVAPHIIREVRAGDGVTTLKRAQPETHRVVSEETARTLRRMLESVTVNGTAKRAQLDGYTAAGKTGTAQKVDPRTHAYSPTKYVASFVGFAPLENPSVVIIVVIDEPVGAHHGGDVAAPVFRSIAEYVLPYLNTPPDTEVKQTLTPLALKEANNGAKREDQTTNGKDQTSNSTEKPGETLPHENFDADDDAFADAASGARLSAGETEIVYASVSDNAFRMPDLRGRSVREVAQTCARLGLELEARGEGRARAQVPKAGASIEAGQTVRVEFAR
jgi:cell division protein FtsI (penicillin-binding protein 3)